MPPKPTTRLGELHKKIVESKDLNADKTLEARRHFEVIDASRAMQVTTLQAFKSLVKYLDNPNRITKTAVTNQLDSIRTPDALEVKQAIENLHETVKTHKNTDLSEVASLLKSVLEQAQQIPKEHQEIEIPKPIDNTKQLNSLEAAIKAVDKTIKEKETKVEAPVVNVPETKITVEKPDLSLIEKEQKQTRQELVKAVKAIVFPELDTKPMEKELKKLNKLFNEFLDSTPSGGGGGGGVVSFVDQNGVASPVTKLADGSLAVTIVGGSSGGSTGNALAAYYYIQKDTADLTNKYYAYMKDDDAWVIKRINRTTNLAEFAKGTANYSTNWTGRAALTYASYGATF